MKKKFAVIGKSVIFVCGCFDKILIGDREMIKTYENKIQVYKTKSLADATYTLNEISRGGTANYTIEEKNGSYVCYKIEKLGKLAVSSTKEGIEKMINEYFYSTFYSVNLETGEVISSIKGTCENHKVIKKGKKIYFYCIQE